MSVRVYIPFRRRIRRLLLQRNLLLTCGPDIAQRLHLLVMKSKIFLLTGQSAKGFSLALRVASTARRHQLLSVLMTALGVLSKILVDLSEFDAARDLLEAALPHVRVVSPRIFGLDLTSSQALGMPDLQLRAELFAWLADAHIGIAQRRDQPRIESINHLNLAVNYVDRSCAGQSCRLLKHPSRLHS